MKKFLSIFLTLCLMLTVVAVPLPAIAETSNKQVFDFENYSPSDYISGSARVLPAVDPDDAENGVVKFDNNGIPYRSEAIAKKLGYTMAKIKNADGTYTLFADTELGLAAVKDLTTNDEKKAAWKAAFEADIKDGGYAKYYCTNVDMNDLKATTKKTITYKADGTKNSIPFDKIESYNAIDICTLEASTTYRITINYKRENLDDALYVQPITWSKTANWRKSMYIDDNYGRITIPTTDTPDSDYVTDFTFITTPAELVSGNNTGTTNGNFLRLILFTGQKAGNNVVYFDNITVEKITYADLTYNYADEDKAPVVVEDLIVGDAIDYADLAPNKLGENNGVWYADAQGTTVAPAAMVEGGLHVYEVVKTGVFDFNNYYNYSDYTGTGSNFAVYKSAAIEVADGVLKYDSSKSAYNTTSITSQNRINSIAIGEAKENTTYKITVYYKRGASTNAISFTPLTGMKTLTGKATKEFYDSVSLSATETADSEYQKAEIVVTTLETFAEDSTYGGKSNCLYLTISTKVDGTLDGNTATLDIDKITVEEYKGSITYVIPEGATVNGENGNVTVGYAVNDAITFPEVVYADGYTFDSWIDTETGAVVDTPVLGGSYTLVVKEPVEMVTITLNRGGVTEEVQVEKGSEFTLPDTEFTDTSWWFRETAAVSGYFAGYEGEKIVVNGNVPLYTAETYSYGQAVDQGYKADQGVYRYWTGIDTTTEDFSYLYKNDTSGASWPYSGGYRVCTRLGAVEDGKTYRISVTYKADTDAAINFYMLTTNTSNSGGSTRNYLEGGKKFHVVAAGTKNEDWTTATFYITVDLPAKVTANADNSGLDDTKTFLHDTLYLNLGKAGGEDVNISIKETLVEDMGKVVEAKGASVLKKAKEEEAGSQAIRYYFDYKTAGDGTTITIGDNEYNVVERGFLYTNGAITYYTGAGKAGKSGDQTGNYFVCNAVNADYGFTASAFMMWLADAKDSKKAGKLAYKGISGAALANNWAFNEETHTVTFSTYVTDIPTESYSAKMMVRGYVIFEADGAQHIVYSETINRSVQGIKDALGTGNPGNNGDHDE